MTCYLKMMNVFVFALVPMASATAQAANAADQQAKFEDQAIKSCNYDLDHDHFGTYASMDDCVADRTEKLSRDNHAKGVAAPTAQPAHQPN